METYGTSIFNFRTTFLVNFEFLLDNFALKYISQI